MRMDLLTNRALRDRGWSYFRSSTRDRVTPATGIGPKLTRIKIGEAYPVRDAEAGVAISDEERAAIALANAARMKPSGPVAVSALSETKYIEFVVNSPLGAPGVIREEIHILGVAPFDGFVTEIQFTSLSGPLDILFAVRGSGGQSFCRTFTDFIPIPGANQVRGDFFNALRSEIAGPSVPITVFRSNMPIRAGEEIWLVTSDGPGVPVRGNFTQGVLGMQSSVFDITVARNVTDATIRARESNAARLELELIKNQGRLALEQEQSRRSLALSNEETDRIALRSNAVIAASRAAPAPVPPRVVPPKSAPPEGVRQTFVSSWMPQAGAIGYLIPDPPRGGKVNVFDNKYSVFDITGRLVEQGQIQIIRADWEIPPGARLSSQRSVFASPGTLLTAGQEQAKFA